MMLARRLLMGGNSDVDPYWDNVVFLLQVAPTAIDGTTDYADAKGKTLIKCSNPLVATSGSEKCISFNGNWIETPTSGVHMGVDSSMYVMGTVDMTYEFIVDIPAASWFVFWSGSPGNGASSNKEYVGGYNINMGAGDKCYFTAGNLSLHGTSRTYGKKTINNCVNVGRNEIVYRVISNEINITVNGVQQELQQRESWTGASNMSNVQTYIQRNVCINAYSKYNCAHDLLTVPIGQSYVTGPCKLISARITRGIARDVQYPIQLPFPTA